MSAVGVHRLPNASKIASSSTHSTAKSSGDMLGQLPEDIVSQILSLMPTKYAVRTSILSKRWRYRWTFVTSLDFDFNRIHPYHFRDVSSKKFVDRVIDSCNSSPIQLFRLHFPTRTVDWSNWIDKAVKLNVCEVDIQAGALVLPLSLFTCKTLTRLKIGHGDWRCPCPVNLPCLKTLDVAVLDDPFVNAFKLISGCPILERLTFGVHYRNDEEDYIFNIPTLKHLKLRLAECSSHINKVVLNLPDLEYLLFDGKLGSLFVVEDLSSLVEASITCHPITSGHLFVELVKALDRVESLTFKKDYIWVEDTLIAAMRMFPNMKHLNLQGYWSTIVILQFLERCPNLKRLGLCIKELCPYWTEPKLVPACMLTNLTSIKFSNLNGKKSEIEFLEYMLRKAEVLKTITITWRIYHIKKEKKEKEEKLCALQRASRDCEIRFYG